MDLPDAQYVDGFKTAALVIASDGKAFTLSEVRRAFGYDLDRHRPEDRASGCCAWLAGFDAGVRSAYGA